jgi:DNA-3-methyladenine glycosylase I
MKRCSWAEGSEAERAYHDHEWGIPVYDDQKLFEMLVLESAQAGLSWSTILNKREGYREAFDNFDARKIADYGEEKRLELLGNPGIVRNRLKINSTISNARLFLEIQEEEGSFSDYIWSFVGGEPIQNKWRKMSDVPATTAESDAMSKALKKRGFKFVGSTICYAYMQATGMVNDHLVDCFCYQR